jgi:1-deoxy-D-xylulose 5-phosphate reductoisomerase
MGAKISIDRRMMNKGFEIIEANGYSELLTNKLMWGYSSVDNSAMVHLRWIIKAQLVCPT